MPTGPALRVGDIALCPLVTVLVPHVGGPITPAAFLQVLINGSGFRWITPLSTIIANIDEVVDDKKATPADKTGAAEAVVALFAPGDPNAIFLPRYLPLLQMNPDMLHAHGQVAQLLREVAEK